MLTSLKAQASNLLLLGAVSMTCLTGCLDTFNTMKPGETEQLDPITYGNEYELNCEVTRLEVDVVTIDDDLFEQARVDENETKRLYLNKTAQVSGLVVGSSFYKTLNDDIELSLGDQTIYCELLEQYSQQELDDLFATTVTVRGTIERISSVSIWLYDTEIVE